jgi:site-specific DNA-methyltransferase (adenine-specific)
MNTLYFGDNLDILREYIPDESVDLIYLDPPFNSKQAYNIIFKDKNGKYPPSQIEAFDDTWHWGDENEEILVELTKSKYPPELVQMLNAFRSFLGNSDLMSYLVMMAIRLWEMRRALKPTGSIYLHCDPTASHYLKIVMDRIFGIKSFRNEISWQRFTFHADAHRWGRLHDILLFYGKDTSKVSFTTQRRPHDEKYIKSHFKEDESGRLYRLDNALAKGQGPPRVFFGKMLEPPPGTHWRWGQKKIDELIKKGRIVLTSKGRPSVKRYLDEMAGHPVGDVWTDIPEINSQAKERLGYPTQKPLALLDRIIRASSDEGGVVMDPFCGCGTAVAAAEKLGRRWIGIDITILAVNLIEKRLREHFPDVEYDIVGIPNDVPSAEKLASTREGKFLFEQWFVTALGGQPYKSSGGGDTGIDGFLYARDVKGKFHNVVISVKGGHYGPEAVRSLARVVDREVAAAGLLLALIKPSRGADAEAAGAGRFQMPGVERSYPKVQIFTVEDYFAGKRPDLPDTSGTLKKAARVKREREKDQQLPL